MTNPTGHQQYQPMPQIGTPFVDASQNITIPWYRLLIDVWKKLGSTFSTLAQAGYVSNAQGTPAIYNSATGELVGVLQLTGPGNPVALPAPGSSPRILAPMTSGLLVVDGAEIELSRDSGATYYQVSASVGNVRMLKGDQTRITWASGTPVIAFFPD